ncbi:hypothetical protein BpHYR1_020868 [Brachionus plicatilis]|uniref:Uncharacterized protein n=1 Tax=Brachionus plicatilis TaxID=10195 RepID=A0A3M7SZD5_BRAPC|nr:hypothetical protein BpHYR1_020868 [Brachionus plicatilis]
MESNIFRMSTDEIIHTWSTDRDPSIAHQDNLKAFVQTPTADTTPLLDSAWKWLLLAKNIISKGNKHYIASGLSKKNELQPADIVSVVVPAMTKRTFASASSALLVISSYSPFLSRSRTCLWEKNESVVLLKKLSRLLLGYNPQII